MSLGILEEALLWYSAIRLRTSHPRNQERLRPIGELTAISISRLFVAFGGPENSPPTSKVSEWVIMMIPVMYRWLAARLAESGDRDPREPGTLLF